MRGHFRIVAVLVLTLSLVLVTVGTAAADSQIHVVQRGETLYRISRTYGVSMDAIRSANGFRGDRIYAGQSLIIPDASAPVSQPPAPVAGC